MAFRLNQEYACADVKAGDRLCAPIGLSAAAVMMLFFGSAAAAPGDLDPSFGSYGIVETEIAGSAAQAEALTLQPDGKIVVAGFMYPVGAGVARYLPDGRL